MVRQATSIWGCLSGRGRLPASAARHLIAIRQAAGAAQRGAGTGRKYRPPEAASALARHWHRRAASLRQKIQETIPAIAAPAKAHGARQRSPATSRYPGRRKGHDPLLLG